MTITTPEKISMKQLRGLASAKPPCITIVLPELEGRDARIAFKDALAQVHTQLEARMPKHDIAALLDPLQSAAAEIIDPSKGPATYIFLRSPDLCDSFHTRYLVGQPTAVVGKSFHLGPLLALASKQLEFYILELKLNDARILKCTDESFEPARFPKSAGTNAADFVSGASQAAIRAEPVHDRDHPDDHLRHFYREVDRDVNALVKDGQPPLVVVGVEHEVALFLRLTTYPECVKPGIHALPGRFVDDEMYTKALELVRSVTTGPTHHALEKFDKQIGTDHASSEIQAIVEAASGGRVEHLFLREAAAVPGFYPADPDLLDEAAVQTLLHGGDVKVLPGALMPGGVPVCAVFRYAAAGC
jgi:hypothetical protein